MRRIILACALAGILSVPAKADETLKFRYVQHVASNQTQQVGDANNHVLGIQRSLGIAFFPDGSTGTTSLIGTYDVLLPSPGGTADGYVIVSFPDSSELFLKYTGTAKYGTPKTALKGTWIVTGGKGRYAGAKGDGTWEGEGTQPAASNGVAISYIDNVINIKK
jgi:hypothetical protein